MSLLMSYWKLTLGVMLLSLGIATSLRADGVFLAGSVGSFKSKGSEALFIGYQRDASAIFTFDSFNELMLGSWNGGKRNNIIALSKGIRWNFYGQSYTCLRAGGAYVSGTSSNMGTHLQFAFDLALGVRMERIDLSIGFKHFSNGKKIFNWTHHSNDGENFITIQTGYIF